MLVVIRMERVKGIESILEQIQQTQSQLRRDIGRHFVESSECRECFRQRVGIGERTRGIFQRRQADRVFRMRLQDRPDHDSGIKA